MRYSYDVGRLDQCDCFFSSRRRHTRFDCDWSSDVCSSDLNPAHTEVVDLDGDGIKDILVADLGNFQPTDERRGSVVWLRGTPDGKFTPVTLLKGEIGRASCRERV